MAVAALGIPASMAAGHKARHDLRLDHLQVIGTHNSYHLAPLVPTRKAYAYSHEPLAAQLDRGVRSLELDVHYRGAPELLVYHSDPDDNRSSCPTLRRCLHHVATWSAANRNHHVLFVMIEAKTGFDELPGIAGEQQRQRALADLDASLDAVGSRRIVTPDEVRGPHHTLREAVRRGGWPSVGETRGRVLFFLVAPERVAESYAEPRAGSERRMFLTSTSDAVVVLHDDPFDPGVPAALRAGLLVRTRADVDLRVDEHRRRRALASGAHVVATDRPTEVLRLTGGSRCNPVTAPGWCRTEMIEPKGQPGPGGRKQRSRT